MPPSPHASPAQVCLAAVCALLATTLLKGLYFAAPLDDLADVHGWLLFAGVFVVFGVVAAWQIRRILRSRYPIVRAVEALAVALPVYWLGFAIGYYLMAAATPQTFSTGLTRMSALYFTITVFCTVGFGDIVALTDTGRAVVTAQIGANLILLGLGGRVLVGAISHARTTHRSTTRPRHPSRDYGTDLGPRKGRTAMSGDTTKNTGSRGVGRGAARDDRGPVSSSSRASCVERHPLGSAAPLEGEHHPGRRVLRACCR
ncbi:MAG TPA: potassium channel family protein [Aldersonia sp.]